MKVLVVDDSALMRRLIGGVLRDAGFAVETARDGREGVERLLEVCPDVVTLDLNMPEMDGLTGLSLMMQARPTPVVLVSSLTTKGAVATLEGLALGAVDFVTKPGGTISLSVEQIAEELVSKVRAAARARLRTPSVRPAPMPASAPSQRAGADVGGPRRALRQPVRRVLAPADDALPAVSDPGPVGNVPGVVLIGVSTGGPRTLEDILPNLPATLPWPVIVAQHMPANFTSAFAERMDRMCALQVVEVRDTMPMEAGRIYIGRGGFDVLVGQRLGRAVLHAKPESPAHAWHPSVELLVETACSVFPPQRIVAVQLTGMGNDGAAAMAALKRAGGRTIAESEESAVVFGMPADLIERGGATQILPSPAIARQIVIWVG
jgi:two-component system chemotaxis response regulator CheB